MGQQDVTSPDRPSQPAQPPHLPRRSSNRVAVLTLIMVFLCGAATGAVFMRLREHQLHVPTPGAPSFSSSVDEWKKQLDLTEDQTRQIVSILDDFSHYYDNVLSDGNSRIMQVLNPEQKRRFERLLQARRR